MSKWHGAGVWSMDKNILRFMFKNIWHIWRPVLDPLLVHDGPLGAPAFVKLAYCGGVIKNHKYTCYFSGIYLACKGLEIYQYGCVSICDICMNTMCFESLGIRCLIDEQLKIHGCVFSTVATDAKAPGHQNPQYWKFIVLGQFHTIILQL